MERIYSEQDGVSSGFPQGWLEPKWYALFVRTNREKLITQQLASRSVEHLLPTYESVRQWQDRKVKLLKPLFPGYIFVNLPLVERSKVLLIHNVVGLVGTKNVPTVISNQEIEWIKLGLKHGKAEPHRYLNVGDWVTIKTGAMAGLKGILVRMQNGTRVLVHLHAICRAFTVEVDSSLLGPQTAPGQQRKSLKNITFPESAATVVSACLS
jgi:transcription antitermination factor NusG